MSPDPFRVLVTDDLQSVRDTVGDHLRSHGYFVETVGAVRGFLDALEGPRFDALVMDVMLDGKMTNQEVLDIFHKRWPGVYADEDLIFFELGLRPRRRARGDLLAVLGRLRWGSGVVMLTNIDWTQTEAARMRVFEIEAIVPKLVVDESRISEDPGVEEMLAEIVRFLEEIRTQSAT
jgi:CheY-like chemotaxis protein